MTYSHTIFVRTSFVGFHAWPAAPKPVGYLANQHRHVFGLRVEVAVDGTDRQVEFHMLKRDTTAALARLYGANEHGEHYLGARSCETVAQDVIGVLLADGYVVLAIECDEDGENGARVYPVLACSPPMKAPG